MNFKYFFLFLIVNIIKPCLKVLSLGHLWCKTSTFLLDLGLVGVAPQGFLAHVRLSEMLDAGLRLLHFLWCHALEGLHAVLVHMDRELVHKVLGLYVGSIRVQDVPITT